MKDPRPRSVDSTDYSERLESAPRALLRKSIEYEKLKRSRFFWRLCCILTWTFTLGGQLYKWQPVRDFLADLFR